MLFGGKLQLSMKYSRAHQRGIIASCFLENSKHFMSTFAKLFGTNINIEHTEGFVTSYQPEYILITGYLRFLMMNHTNANIEKEAIPSNILNEITNYCGIIDYGLSNQSLNLLSITNDTPLSQMKLVNVNEMKSYDVQINYMKAENASSKHYKHTQNMSHSSIPFLSLTTMTRNPSICGINNIPLPLPFQNMLKCDNLMDREYSKDPLIENNKCNVSIFIGGNDFELNQLKPSKLLASDECNICAFPKSISALQDINRMNKSEDFNLFPKSMRTSSSDFASNNNKARDYKQMINGFHFKFPSLPQPMYGLNTIYDKYHNKLYAMNPWNIYSTNIWCSDLNASNFEELQWNEITNKLLMSRSNTSICMVDRGRFIAIMGGKGRFQYRGIQTKGIELYSPAANKSIKLSLMNRFSENGASIYNEDLHNIILGDSVGFELYDINKDKWYHLYDRYYNTLVTDKYNKKPNLWISESNPFIVYMAGYKKIKCQCKWTGEIDETNYCIEKFDIREYTKKPIVELKDVSWESLSKYNELLRFDTNIIKTTNTQITHLTF